MAATLDDVVTELRAIRHLLEVQAAGEQPSDGKVVFIPKKLVDKYRVRTGLKFSQYAPEFLKEYAATMRWIGDQQEAENKMYKGKPEAPRSRERAAMATAWAKWNAMHGVKPVVDDAPESGSFESDGGFDTPAAQHEKRNYGTSGHGASAKHGVTKDTGFDDGGDKWGDDNEIPF